MLPRSESADVCLHGRFRNDLAHHLRGLHKRDGTSVAPSGCMKKLAWLIAISLPLAACVVGEDGTAVDPGGDDQGSGSGSGSGSNTSPNTISVDTTWSGTFAVSANLTIAAGVTVTVEPGTTISFAPGGYSITVNGTLDAQGTKAAPITIGPSAPGGSHAGLQIPTGGLVNLNYVIQTGGGIHTSGGKATIVDTFMSGASGSDFLVMSGGELDMSYSQVGKNVDETDTTHCNLHFGGVGNIIKVTNSNISTTPYGLMFYGGTNANFTNNNWFGNQIDVATNPGVQGDFTGSWFEDAPPSALGNGGAQLTVTGLAGARLPTAGPR